MKRNLFLLLLCLIAGNSFSQSNKIKVYLLGTFHFAQTDTNVYDVKSAVHQKSIEELSDKIVNLNPDKIFIERMPEFEYQNRMDSLYQQYRKGKLRHARNEIWQVAARTASRLNHEHLYQCDQPGSYGMHYGNCEEYVESHNQKEKLQYKGKGMTTPATSLINPDSLRNTMGLVDYLRWLNSSRVQESSHAHYINVYPQIGNTNPYQYDSTYFLGANLTIDWYRRNILIYSKMIAQLDYTEKAIFLLIGNDHVPIIRHLFESNPYFEVVATEKWLGKINNQ